MTLEFLLRGIPIKSALKWIKCSLWEFGPKHIALALTMVICDSCCCRVFLLGCFPGGSALNNVFGVWT